MKIAINLFITILLIFCCLFSFPVYASFAEGSINTSKNYVAVGETFNVMFNLKTDTAVYALQCRINYDNTKIKYVSGVAVGGAGSLVMVEAPYGQTEVSYVLTFRAISSGESNISMVEGSYAVLGNNGAEERKFNSHNVVVNIYNVSEPAAPTIAFIDSDTVELEYTDNFEYSIDGINWQRSNIFSGLMKDTIYSFYQREIPAGNSMNSLKSVATKAIIVSAPKVLVGSKTLKFVPVDGYQYSINGIKFQQNNFFDNLIPNWNYTVYQEPINKDDLTVYYTEHSIEVCTNGFDEAKSPNATHLTMLRKELFNFVDSNLLGADFNADFNVNILDYVYLKKYLLN